jgi:hypothetical protein
MWRLMSLAWAVEHDTEEHSAVHVGLETAYQAHEVTFGLHAVARAPWRGRLGGFASGRMTTHHNYAEAYLGPYLDLGGGWQVGFGAGLETYAHNPWRLALVCDWERPRWQALAVVEYGGSGYWYHGLAAYQIHKMVAVGVFAQRFDGLGPMAQWRLGPMRVWAAGLYNPEHEERAKGSGFVAGLDLHL